MTLVELVVALTILVSVSAASFVIFRGITRAWKTGALRTERYQQARFLFDLFERELSSCVANPRYPLVGLKRGEASPLHAGRAVADELMFVGALPGRTGLVERGYWVDAEGTLMCHDDESRDGTYATGASEACGRGLSAFEIGYFNGTEWIDRWDAARQGVVPHAVRIALTLRGERPERFETVVHVPAS
ncbi:MAG: hypothetical protein HYY59_08095 [Candidatus Omnitrophica bacterium]|nr:hypothetical protein [Candidatus Omnitrophota bacterium]MBI3021944.1 hypothetical protein [Candidatus Omnitrophota bacterium]